MLRGWVTYSSDSFLSAARFRALLTPVDNHGLPLLVVMPCALAALVRLAIVMGFPSSSRVSFNVMI